MVAITGHTNLPHQVVQVVVEVQYLALERQGIHQALHHLKVITVVTGLQRLVVVAAVHLLLEVRHLALLAALAALAQQHLRL